MSQITDYFVDFNFKINGCFIVQNITRQSKKTINIFNYPIPYGMSRDLLQIPGLSESDIKASLLKGELRYKLLARDIIVTCSDIDLISFNSNQTNFLVGSGINPDTVDPTAIVAESLEELYPNGSGSSLNNNYLIRDNQLLLGQLNGINRLFKLPNNDSFIHGMYDGNALGITVIRDGRQLLENVDFLCIESGGSGTGYDSIKIISLPPVSGSIIWANYFVKP
jgi:hypothetical protein